MSNKIVIRSVYKVTSCIMEPAPDQRTGKFAKCVRKVNSQGDLLLTDEDRRNGFENLIGENETILIFDGKEFDLDDPYDAAWWEAIRNSRRIAADRSKKDENGHLIIDGDSTRYGSAEFYVEYPGREAKVKIDKRRDVNRAEQFIFDDTNEGVYTKAKILGSNMNNLPVDTVVEYLLDVASKSPKKIIDLYTGQDIHLHILLVDALDKGVIKHINKQFYKYGENTVLGASTDSVIAWMKFPNNKGVLDMIKAETYPDAYELPELKDSELDQVSGSLDAAMTPAPRAKKR